MHRLMLDDETRTVFEGIWFTNGPVVICDDDNQIEIYDSVAALHDAHPQLDHRWLNDAPEHWDDVERRSLRGLKFFEGLTYTLPG